MMKNILVLSLLWTVLAVLPNSSFAFVPDGKLGDWGVTPGVWSGPAGTRINSSDWAPDAGIQSAVEDYDPIGDGYLNPGWGGQLFDAEAMYARFDSDTFYFAVVTGHSPSGTLWGGNLIYPGDIAIDFGSGYQYGIETLNGSRTAGGMYSVLTWDYSPWNGTDPTEMKVVDLLMSVDSLYYYGVARDANGDPLAGDHYVIEGSIGKSAFGTNWGKAFTMSWTQICGNDVIRLGANPVPEPATMTLLGLGLGGLAFIRRKKQA